MSADAAPIGPWQRPSLWVAICVLPILVWSLLPDHPRIAGVFHDDGSYVELGKSLVARGEYRDAHYPDPLRTAKYPPGVPLLVAAGLVLGGDLDTALTWVRLFNLAFLALALWSFFAILRRSGLARCAPALLLAVAWGGASLDFVRVCMSEVPYLGVSLFAIDRLLRVDETSKPWPTAALLGGLSCAAFALRSFAMVLLIATLLHLLWQKRTAIAWRFAAVVVPLVGALQLFLSAASRPQEGYEDITVYGLSYTRILFDSLDWIDSTILVNGLRSALYTVYHVLPVAKWLPIQETWGVAVSWGLVVGIAVLVVLGVRAEWRRREDLRPWHLLVLGTFLLVLPWPADPSRFLIPVVPFLLLLIVRAVERLAGANGAFIAAIVLAFCAVIESVPIRMHQSPTAFSIFGGARNAKARIDQAHLMRRLPPGSVVASTFDSTLAAHGDVRGVWGWTITADEHVYRYAPGRAAFGLAWQFEPWLQREAYAAHAFFVQQLGETVAAVETARGDAREPLLAAFESDRARVREQFRRLGVTHAAISLTEGAWVFDILLARLVRELAEQGRARVVRDLSRGAFQVWKLQL